MDKGKPVIGSINADIHFDALKSHIGSPVTMTLSMRYPEGAAIEFPSIPESLVDFSVVPSGPPKMTKTEGYILQERSYQLVSWKAGKQIRPFLQDRSYQLVSWKAGKQTLPEFVFHAVYKGESQEITTPSQTLTIASLVSVEPDVKFLKEIKSPYDIPFSWKPYRPWLMTFLGLIALILIGVLLFRWLKRRKKKALRLPEETPWAKALRLIEEMKKKTYSTRTAVSLLYYDLSLVIRYYIEERFHLAAPERTTEEFLAMLADDTTVGNEYKDILKHFLNECDQVKFALYEPTKKEISRIIASGEEFIKNTIPAKQGEPHAGV